MQVSTFRLKFAGLSPAVTLTIPLVAGIWLGWMDELGFYVPSTVFQSFRDDGRVNMKGSVQ